jgi:hypothetical protein
MMESLDYPVRAGHKKQYAAFIRTVTSHNADYATRTRQGASVLVNDLKDWLLSHIVIEDAKFAKLCREKNAEALAISKKLIQEKKSSSRKRRYCFTSTPSSKRNAPPKWWELFWLRFRYCKGRFWTNTVM